MTMHPRLMPIPGCETHPADAERRRHAAAVKMALDALCALPPDMLCQLLIMHVCDRDDIPLDALQRLATALDRKAWAGMPAEGGA